MDKKQSPNRLINEASPYLIEHAYNPVDWFPWGEEAFEKARAEDKPVFLSIGYSSCHWCHVMGNETFMDAQAAELLNEHFISIKVDREERPDIDSVYMAVCQAFTGSGGWPMSIFLTPERKPFFAGTYFPKRTRYGTPGFIELINAISEKWRTDRDTLLSAANEAVELIAKPNIGGEADGEALIAEAERDFTLSFDKKYGGFGGAPKFPAAHNLIFLMTLYQIKNDENLLDMAKTTLEKLYRGGIFDHIGYGFSRYSTDKYFLVPHFEKMLYDNALLILAYSKAYEISKNRLYLTVAKKTAEYVLREMTSPEGGFYSAQDADSEGVEGKYYTFSPSEIIKLLGQEKGEKFNEIYGIVTGGNFEGMSIPNLLPDRDADASLEESRAAVYEYRRNRTVLHLDDKLLTAWNSLMIAALCALYRVSGEEKYLAAAKKARELIEKRLCDGDTLFVSTRASRRGQRGFLDEYAYYIFALISLYDATLDKAFLIRAAELAKKAESDFYDAQSGGYYLYSHDSEALIFRPKDAYDGAMPSGNSMMAYALVRLSQITSDVGWAQKSKAQLKFMSGAAKRYPTGYTWFLTALLHDMEPPAHITIALKDKNSRIPLKLPLDATVEVLDKPTAEYPLKDDKTTFYVCKNHKCLPPVNDIDLIWP